MTLGSHQRSVGKSQVHITPKWIIDALGPFDLDPCAADPRPWKCARENWTTDGLRGWDPEKFIWLNPPFNRYEVALWLHALAAHRNGIALLHARTETDWFRPCWQHASGILFMDRRISFYSPQGVEHPANSGAPPVLVAFGPLALDRLRKSGIIGALLTSWTMVSSPP